MDLLLARIFDGLATGSLYATIALALVLIYSATALVNFAQGEMAMFGAFVVYVLAVEQGWAIWLALPVAMLASAGAGAGIHRVVIRRFDAADHLPLIMVTLGFFLLLNSLAAMIWTSQPRRMPAIFPSGDLVSFGVANLRWYSVGVAASSVAVLVVLSLILKYTKVGYGFRAVSDNLASARLVGIRVDRTIATSWALAAAVGTFSATLYVSDPLRGLDPNVMLRVFIFAAAAAVLGGLTSLWGSLAGGLILGLSESLITGYVSFIPSEFGLLVALVVLVAVLAWRPTGLFGAKATVRV